MPNPAQTLDTANGFTAILQPYMPIFYVSFLVTVILTPLMRGLAHRHGVVDDPDGKRKVHAQPIAYLGGISIFLGWLAGVSVAVFLRPHNAAPGSLATIQIPPGVMLGAATVVLFGLIDDIYSLSPRIKLFGQFLAAMLLILPGSFGIFGGTDLFTGVNSLLGGHADTGPVWMIIHPMMLHGFWPHRLDTTSEAVRFGATVISAIVAICVIISTCNATNLIDGLDGLCSGVTGVVSLGYLILALYLAQAAISTQGGVPADPPRIALSLALLGAVLGFLPFNFNPASIFMGDTGSMFLGFICGTMILLFGQWGTVSYFLSAIIMFGLPMMDTLLAIVRRKLNGKAIFSPDSDHFHHFLIKRGFSVRQAVFISYGMAALFVSFGLIIVIIPTTVAVGVYLVLFGWIIVAAFKMGMVFQNSPNVALNTSLNLAVISPNGASPTVMANAAAFPEMQEPQGVASPSLGQIPGPMPVGRGVAPAMRENPAILPQAPVAGHS